jgi:hypothetical protein
MQSQREGVRSTTPTVDSVSMTVVVEKEEMRPEGGDETRRRR